MWTSRATLPNQLPLNKTILIITLLLGVLCSGSRTLGQVVTGAERTDQYVDKLRGKKVGILTNHTGLIEKTHLVDSLISSGINVKTVFAPEHGFRGSADAGENVESYTDPRTGVRVVSIYGSNKRPKDNYIKDLDIIIFDIQDVGLRYYTYLSSLHYMMEACAANGRELIIFDRPNPNGFYVDGPILEPKYKSFVGMHPIPVVHGMTLGELALMINGEGWLEGKVKCDISIVKCLNYTHRTKYELPVKPSPNLPNMRSVYLYSSLCFFEGTPLSIGRGTSFPFQIYGHPALPDEGFYFTPQSTEGAKNPPLKDKKCYGHDLRQTPSDEKLWQEGIDLSYIVDSYRIIGGGDKFFLPIFNLLTGTGYIKEMIIAGASARQIEERWRDDVEKFRNQRKPYLLYAE